MNLKRLFVSATLAALSSVCVVRAAPSQQTNSEPPPQASTPADGVERITLDDFKALIASGRPFTLIDVRYQINEKIKGAAHIPMGEIEARLAEIPRDREVVTYCA